MTNEELVEKIQQGQETLMPELWQNIELLSKKFAAKYARMITDGGTTGDEQTLFEDLHSCGYIALVAAVQSFKPEKDTKFSSWFVFYLRQEIYHWMGWRNVGAGKTVCNDLHSKALSLDAEINDDGTTRQDLIADDTDDFEAVERKLYNEQLHAVLADCLATLPQAEKAAIKGSYYDGLTLQEMAEREGVAIESIRQRQSHGMRSLRRGKCVKALQEFYSDSDIRAAGLARGNSTERVAIEMAMGRRII